MDIFQRIRQAGIVPVVIIDHASDAVPTAKALLNGGIDVMEITFRTPAAAKSIEEVAFNCPDLMVGAGTVLTLDQCKIAVSNGAKFIVFPGFDEKIVSWCAENGVMIIPGCVTPTEIMATIKYNLTVIKFFPANIYGGLNAMKSLSAPFGSIRFIPTGGIGLQNIKQYISEPFVHALGGSWVCPKNDISEGNFKKITDMCIMSRSLLLGYEFADLANSGTKSTATDISASISKYELERFHENQDSIVFPPNLAEILNRLEYDGLRSVELRTNCIDIAINDFRKKGFSANMEAANKKDGKVISVCLEKQGSGVSVHLLQK